MLQPARIAPASTGLQRVMFVHGCGLIAITVITEVYDRHLPSH
jgi:hypothetical protein